MADNGGFEICNLINKRCDKIKLLMTSLFGALGKISDYQPEYFDQSQAKSRIDI